MTIENNFMSERDQRNNGTLKEFYLRVIKATSKGSYDAVKAMEAKKLTQTKK